ncbi:MAG: TetR/AcrR family transcriptional regulator [Pseudomonadota bacterium]|nr:TetR/AcrR family transcriptional regulator [Pseudomonadota bacterium]
METQASHSSNARGRPREFDVDAALDLAIDVFRQRGYTATTLAELAAGMGLSRGSLYKAFHDKQSVFVAAYNRYANAGAQGLELASTGPGSARERLEAVLALYARQSQGEEGRQGCLVVATAIELSVTEPVIAQRVLASWQRTERVLLRLLKEGAQDGSIPERADPAATARTLLCLLQGMRIVGKGSEMAGPAMERVAHAALGLFD